MDKKEGLLFRPDGRVKQALEKVTSLQGIIGRHQQSFSAIRELGWLTLNLDHPELKLFEAGHTIEKGDPRIIAEDGATVYTILLTDAAYTYFKMADELIDNAEVYINILKEANKTAADQVKERFGINVADGSYIYNHHGNFIEPNPAYVKPMAEIEAEKADDKPFLEAVKDPFGEDDKNE